MGASVYQSERELRKWGIQGQDLAKITRQLKKDISTLEKQSAYKPSTGEISTVGEFKHEQAVERAKRGAETRKANKEAERAFWTGEQQPEVHLKTPQLGDMAYYNVLDVFITKLYSPLPEMTMYGNRRRKKAIKRSKEAQSYIQKIWDIQTKIEGITFLGERLAKNWDRVNTALDYVLIGSDGLVVTTAMETVVSVIQGRPLTEDERKNVNDENEIHEMWSEDDMIYE